MMMDRAKAVVENLEPKRFFRFGIKSAQNVSSGQSFDFHGSVLVENEVNDVIVVVHDVDGAKDENVVRQTVIIESTSGAVSLVTTCRDVVVVLKDT